MKGGYRFVPTGAPVPPSLAARVVAAIRDLFRK